MKNQPVAVTQPITFCAFPAVCLWGCDMKPEVDFIKKNKAAELADKLINSAELNETITRHGYQEFDDISSQIDFWNQHISNCLVDDNKNISFNNEFKTKVEFYCYFLDEISSILRNQSHLFKEDPASVLKKM
ncbi:hypothetical protein WD144_002029 [Salmonella enterica]|nr:hypothetical protein [Salmonella enterica]EID8317996.1 hypothetical protein [Salmonella enterica]EIE4967113.1 hypothetical protein [Salmonella enterica]ELY1054825.1 hypothetical protein [Salmonella enterica]